MDSLTPSNRTSRRVLKRLGNDGFGALILLYCFAAAQGKDPTSPGRCVDSDSDAIPREDLVEACGLSEEDFDALIAICVETKCVDREAWLGGELNFPGMLTRCDDYAHKVMRRLAAEARTKGVPPPTSTTPPSTPPLSRKYVQPCNRSPRRPLSFCHPPHR